MQEVIYTAKRDFEIIDFMGNEHPVKMFDKLDGSYVGKRIDDVKIYSVRLSDGTVPLYTEGWIGQFFDIKKKEVDDEIRRMD